MLQVSSLGQSGASALSISDPLLSPRVAARPSLSIMVSLFLIIFVFDGGRYSSEGAGVFEMCNQSHA